MMKRVASMARIARAYSSTAACPVRLVSNLAKGGNSRDPKMTRRSRFHDPSSWEDQTVLSPLDRWPLGRSMDLDAGHCASG
jgi:hypothetical protein